MTLTLPNGEAIELPAVADLLGCPSCGSAERKPQWQFDGKANFLCLDKWHANWRTSEQIQAEGNGRRA